MKLTVFQSDKGDCLLVTGADGTNILADGGMYGSYKEHVAPALGRMAEDSEVIDLAYVSHVDQDHVAGILTLMDDAVRWRIFDFQTAQGNNWSRPERPRPPEIRAVWHNAFQDQVTGNRGAIEDVLVTVSQHLHFAGLRDGAQELAGLATSIAEALKLADRIADNQLGIPWNEEFGRTLMFVFTPEAPLSIGGIDAHVIGPFGDELRDLREEWNDWVRDNRDRIRSMRERARDDARRMGLSEAQTLVNELRIGLSLGDRGHVSAPNLASLMLVLAEDGKRVVMTGDGHWETVLDGLENAGMLDASGRAHVDVLKVPHHGSEHNASAEFFRRLTADHYVFCGNGAHHNPDRRIVEALLDARVGSDGQRATHPDADGPFKLWFNSSKEVAGNADRAEHMKKVEKLVGQRARQDARIRSRFLKQGSKFQFTV